MCGRLRFFIKEAFCILLKYYISTHGKQVETPDYLTPVNGKQAGLFSVPP